MFFKAIHESITQQIKEDGSHSQFIGISEKQWLFLMGHYFSNGLLCNKNHLFLFSHADECEECYEISKEYLDSSRFKSLLFPGLEENPYSGIIASERNLYERMGALGQIVFSPSSSSSSGPFFLCFATVESFLLKNPPLAFFQNQFFKISLSDIISPFELIQRLSLMGYTPAISVEEPGSFSHKGEVFDIYPMMGGPVRLYYFDDMIEEIFPIDLSHYKTNRNDPLESVALSVSPLSLCQKEYSNTLREMLPQPSIKQREQLEKRKSFFQQMKQGHLFENYPTFVPLFFKENNHLLDFFPKDSKPLIHILSHDEFFQTHQNICQLYRESFEELQNRPDSRALLPEPQRLYFEKFYDLIKGYSSLFISEAELFDQSQVNSRNQTFVRLEKNQSFFKKRLKEKVDFKKIEEKFEKRGDVIFTFEQTFARDQFKFLLDNNGLKEILGKRLHFFPYPLKEGFYYEQENTLLVTQEDLFSHQKKKKVKSHKQFNKDLFAEQLATLKSGDFVIHSEYGVGKYLGLESIAVGKNQTADFLLLLYANDDKVYVPVYRMNLIQKYAEQSIDCKIESLRTSKFSHTKQKARTHAKKLAFDLLELFAKRESSQAFAFSPPDENFREFEKSFPFQETPDQEVAIKNVLEDMQESKPMDHLVCGDVGFGKTEVAMRATFKAVLDHKQVAILVPTTILALQHYNSFKERFKGIAVQIEYLSRFKTAKEIALIFEKLASGEIDVIIGTHKLLNPKISFFDLGLIIVDEEQRFGVGHKEKLKLLKNSVDFLSMSATPIPRTLQMAFLKLRNVSLIATAPLKRYAIKTYLIRQSDETLQSAIRKELQRGGQVFVIHNRVQSIDSYATFIKNLVPEASVIIGHGQLSEKELEKRINDFYQGKYQILVSTTIIESGLDIPNANTLIVDRADSFGLAQLHQIRGRIGRSHKKAYAYFVIPKFGQLSQIAEQRLKTLQTYASMGDGFNIASHDLELRGAGNLLGAEQSGHVEAIGLELYMELLQEAIDELKGEKKNVNKNIEIDVAFPAFIPGSYIGDSGERLRQYKRLSNCTQLDQLEQLRDEMVDIFGKTPEEIQNLFTLLEGRIHLQHSGLKSISLNGTRLSLQFDQEWLEGDTQLRDQIAQNFLQHPKLYQFSPDYKVLYKKDLNFNPESFLNFCKDLAQKIIPS